MPHPPTHEVPNEGEIRKKQWQTDVTYETTDAQQRTAIEEFPWNGQ